MQTPGTRRKHDKDHTDHTDPPFSFFVGAEHQIYKVLARVRFLQARDSCGKSHVALLDHCICAVLCQKLQNDHIKDSERV